MSFPIDLSQFKTLAIDPFTTETLAAEQLDQLKQNIQVARDAIVFFTAVAAGKGLGGHTGGPYDIVPEVLIADAFMKGSDKVVPLYFDEAGHRVAIQYLMSVLNGEMDVEKLMHYREAHQHLPGHPERDFTPGVKFSSGRLGHMWPYVNGVAMANPGKVVFMFGSDGSQMEGDDAEAARLAVAQNLNVKLAIDDNDVTIAGFPSEYLPGYDVGKTLTGHGLSVNTGEGEDIEDLFTRMRAAVIADGPVALINKRPMCPGIEGLEGSNHGHDVISVDKAITYLTAKGYTAAVEALNATTKGKHSYDYKGSEGGDKNRSLFGTYVSDILDTMTPEERVAKVKVVDSDLEGSCGTNIIHDRHPEVFVAGGIAERGNFSAAAGFGMEEGQQGIFATFSAFLEMIVSESTMARLNYSNVICHFSHAGVDDMADNTCHFGINNFYADNGLEDDHNPNKLYFPADGGQLKAVLAKTFWDKGIRFIFSTRSAVPKVLNEDGSVFYDDNYEFTPGKDEVIREGTAGYIVSYGDALYRALDAVERLKEAGIDVGLINKSTLNVVDEETMVKIGASPFVMVVESQNRKTGLGSRFGTWLLERGFSPKYAYLGTTKEGSGGLWEQYYHQGLDPESIIAKVKSSI